MLHLVLIILGGMVAFYVPIQFYAHRLQKRLNREASDNKIYFYCYLIWYTPLVICTMPLLLTELRIQVVTLPFVVVAFFWLLISYFILEQWWKM